MKPIKQLFFALSMNVLIVSCTNNNGSGTDNARKGSISTQPGEIENTDHAKSTQNSDDKTHRYNESKSDSTKARTKTDSKKL
jgi:hypothetical protein